MATKVQQVKYNDSYVKKNNNYNNYFLISLCLISSTLFLPTALLLQHFSPRLVSTTLPVGFSTAELKSCQRADLLSHCGQGTIHITHCEAAFTSTSSCKTLIEVLLCFPASVNYVAQLYHHSTDAGRLN